MPDRAAEGVRAKLGPEDIDDVDREILALLRKDGRMANVQIARTLGVSEATVRKRLDRLRTEGVVQIIGLVNPSVSRLSLDVIVGLDVAPGRVVEVADRLSERDEVVWVAHVTGRYHLLIEVLVSDNSELIQFMTDSLGPIDGILSSETITVLFHRKLDYILDLPGGPHVFR